MKKALTLLLLTVLLTVPLAGCSDTDDTPAETTEGMDDNIPEYNATDANPASDFEYEVGEDGGITITKYIGTDESVVIPEKIDGKNVTVIGESAFRENQTLISVALPKTVTIIQTQAFESCSKLTTVVLDENLAEIQESAFGNCRLLSRIDLPDSLSYIGRSAFQLCQSLKSISIPGNCFRSIDGNGVMALDSEFAFAQSGLETVVIEEGVEILQTCLFYGTKISRIELPSSVRVISNQVFENCASLETIVLNEGLQKIHSGFIDGTVVKEIIIPQSVERMDAATFDNAMFLKKVYFEGNMPATFDYQQDYWDKPFTIYYHEGATGFTTPEWMGYKTEIW